MLTLLVLLAVFVAHVPVTGAQIAAPVPVERAGRAALLRAGPAARHAGEGPGRAGGDQHALPADGVPVGAVVPAVEPAEGDAVDRAGAAQLPPQRARAGCGGHRAGQSVAAHPLLLRFTVGVLWLAARRLRKHRLSIRAA